MKRIGSSDETENIKNVSHPKEITCFAFMHETTP